MSKLEALRENGGRDTASYGVTLPLETVEKFKSELWRTGLSKKAVIKVMFEDILGQLSELDTRNEGPRPVHHREADSDE